MGSATRIIGKASLSCTVMSFNPSQIALCTGDSVSGELNVLGSAHGSGGRHEGHSSNFSFCSSLGVEGAGGGDLASLPL